jgi:hypothetical protein
VAPAEKDHSDGISLRSAAGIKTEEKMSRKGKQTFLIVSLALKIRILPFS